MNLIDCNDLRVEEYRMYGGATGPKFGVWYNGKLYMLKMQQNVRQRGFKNVEISYANDPISEYIGSHVYELCGIPVHETLLGEYKGKMCVLCRDYSYPGRVIEFREWRNRIIDEEVIQHYSGMSSKISDIMQVIDKIDAFNKSEVKQRFWDMFVVDALIGNTDRNNGNWGFQVNGDNLELYPVYDCGGCLNNKKSDEQMRDLLMSGDYRKFAYDFTTSIMDDSGHRINPLHYIRDSRSTEVGLALNKLPTSFDGISKMVESLKDVISFSRISWYNTIMSARLSLLAEYKDSFYGGSVTDKFINASKILG